MSQNYIYLIEEYISFIVKYFNVILIYQIYFYAIRT